MVPQLGNVATRTGVVGPLLIVNEMLVRHCKRGFILVL